MLACYNIKWFASKTIPTYDSVRRSEIIIVFNEDPSAIYCPSSASASSSSSSSSSSSDDDDFLKIS